MMGEEVDYQKDLVSYETDMYSLGILAIEMLIGQPPLGYCTQGNTKEYLQGKIREETEKIDKILCEAEISSDMKDLIKLMT